MAKEVSSVIGQKSRQGSEEIVAEGQEPFEFWELLGGKTPYANDKSKQVAGFQSCTLCQLDAPTVRIAMYYSLHEYPISSAACR